MEYYDIFIKVLLKEISKFKLNTEIYSTHVSQLTAALDENFDISYNRCAYMYRYATGFTFFFNDCIKKFFSSYSHTKDLFSMWNSYSEVKVCSLSVGPGLDYLGFILAVLEYDSAQTNFDIKVVSKYGAWRNTASLILEVFNEQGSAFKLPCPKLKYQNIKVIQADILKSYSSNLNIAAVSEANVILMMKTLNLLAPGSTQEGLLLHMLKELVSSLKSETIIFCIDTKPSIAVFTQALLQIPGKYLYGPIHQTVQLPAVFPEINGNHPTISVRGAFFVWQKATNSLMTNIYNSPFKNTCAENKVDNLSNLYSSGDKCYASSAENLTKIENNDTVDNSNLPWIELKSFWKCSSPKTKELLRRVMLTDEGSLEDINDLISQSEKLDMNKANPLKTDETLAKEGVELVDTKIISTPSGSKMQELSVDNQKAVFNNLIDLHSDNSESISPCNTLNSVSSFTCGNTFPEFIDLDTLPIWSEKLPEQICHELSENSMKIDTKEAVTPKENCKKKLSSENKTIQTDKLLENPSVPSYVKALTDKIRQLTISLAQQDDPSNSPGGDFFPFDHYTEGPDNHTNSTDKPSSSKQSPSFGFKEQGSLPSYHSYRNAPCQNMGGHYSCQCSHNRCMNCCFHSCCAQPVPRCSFSCNHQQSRENNLANVTSSNIVIPLQNISDNALLQIVSILKSDSKN